MRHPLWILNSAIAVLLIGAFLFMLLSRQKVPYRESIEPELSAERIKRDEIKINLSKIYENDLFDTYQKEFKQPISPAIQIPVPQAPIPELPRTPEIPKPEFLDPLNITLKGIVVIASDDSKNRAVIQDNQTKNEQTYKVGNTIGDAQLIRIFKNKVIFLRSNGQQEVLYLREKDAELDPTYAALSGWENVVKKIDTYHYTINPKAFIERIQNLAQFIDMLDLTTAFQKGRSIGCRVGQTKKHSLGAALGFTTGDIITHVDNIPATDTAHRFQIYKNIIAKKPNEPITVQVLREHEPTTLVYALEDFSILDKLERTNPAQELALEEKIKEKQIKAMQQKHAFAPSVRDLRKRERQNMLSRGRMPIGYKPTQTTE
jgi:type II secretory pathway component PulC